VADRLARAVFLDRDGTLMKDVDYCGDPKNVHVFPGAAAALSRLKQGGYKIIVITNQSGIGRGYFDETAYRAVEAEVARQVGRELIDSTYFCPHTPDDNCECRKPGAAMVLRAADDQAVDLARSFFIGDKESDLECGRRAGTRTILVQTGYGKTVDPEKADATAADLAEAAHIILEGTDE
jgi:D-glycero-D-manno-heptose 1,7-bisphosphate phosphatase